MIDFLRGKLVERNPTHLIIECNGIGYYVHISLNTYSHIKNEEYIKINTYLSVKEDSHTLYGFHNATEREVFSMLISVSGVGVNTALIILSSLTIDDIRGAIVQEDVNVLKSVKGIGAKSAQRIILELKDKMVKKFQVGVLNTTFSKNRIKEEILTALEVLGFSKKSCENVVDNLICELPNAPIEQIIKNALKKL